MEVPNIIVWCMFSMSALDELKQADPIKLKILVIE